MRPGLRWGLESMQKEPTMGRWWIYIAMGILGIMAGYAYTTTGVHGAGMTSSVVLSSALRQVVLLGIGWALLHGGRRTLGTLLAVSACALLAAHLGVGLALLLGSPVIHVV